MKLAELEPQFLKFESEKSFAHVKSIMDADGIFLLCPKCFQDNNGPIGTHAVLCWSPKVPMNVSPGPGRWNLQGTGYADLTLVAGSSSVLLTGGCNAHFYIRNGEISFA